MLDRVNKLKMYYQNVRGLRTKCMELYNGVACCDFDILLFTETWLQDDILNSELCDNRYDIFRMDRNLHTSYKKTGGGVMACLKSTLGARQNLCFTSKCGTELLHVTVPSHYIQTENNLNIILIYLAPDQNKIPVQLEEVGAFIDGLVERRPDEIFLLVGDFNLPCFQWQEDGYILLNNIGSNMQNAAQTFVNSLSYAGLVQFNQILNGNGRSLDLVFCNLNSQVDKADTPLLREDMHHPSLLLTIKDLHVRPLKEVSTPRRNFRRCDYIAANDYLSKVDWDGLLGGLPVDVALEGFYNTLDDCFDHSVPLTKVNKAKRKYPVWYSTALIKLIREKSKFHKKWKLYGNPRDYDTFTMLRKRVHVVTKMCHDRYILGFENNMSRDPKTFWSYVKSRRGGSQYPKQLTYQNNTFADGASICANFNLYFQSMFSEAVAWSGPSESVIDDDPVDILSRISVSQSGVEKLLRTLDVSKGSGCDGVPPLFLKMCAKSLSYPIFILYEQSLKQCVCPVMWKKAHIVPVHKKGSKSEITNYRPISILNTLSKLLEKLIYNGIYRIVKQGISHHQHGFLRHRSTISNLAEFTDYVLRGMECHGQVDVIYTDFEKAFDRVDHAILLNKLFRLGIRGDLLGWVTSYLTNRSQAVVMGGFRSDFIRVPSGVPQGSHLGPLFYCAYIYDIHRCFKNSEHILYADDKKVYKTVSSFSDCVSVQDDLNTLVDYYKTNNITVNINKCQCISFSHRRKEIIEFDYNFGGERISRTNLVRDLGILMDSKMLFSDHVNYVTNKAYRNLGFLMRTCRPFGNCHSLKIVYYAYCRSILEYGSPVWNPQYDVYIKMLERIQKKFINHLNFKYFKRKQNYAEDCKHYNLLPLDSRRNLLDLCLLYDVVNHRLDAPNLLRLVTFCTPKYRTRHTPLFQIPRHRRNYTRNAVMTRLPRAYNRKFAHIDIFNISKQALKRTAFADN
jgi:hypothetical protein